MSVYIRADSTTRVEVGQVWSLGSINNRSEYYITSIHDGSAWSIILGQESKEHVFGDVFSNGLPRWHCPGWIIKTMTDKEIEDMEDRRRRAAHADKYL